MMWQSGCLLLLATLCVAQRTQTSSGERQIRLEDIERDNLAASQKPASPSPSQHQQPLSSTREQQQQQQQQQQLAAYQQQLLLQQLQQQYFAPVSPISPLAYSNFGGVPLMIIHSNHLGAGSPQVPIQAYFVPAEPQYLPQYQHPLYQPLPRYQVPAQRLPVQRVPVPLTPDLTYNSIQQVPSVQTYRQSQNYPSASVVYAGTPVQSAQAYQPQTQAQNQQLYNAYNALYQQQRQEKGSFGVGVKSTPAPSHKSQSQIYTSPSVNSAQYSTLKNYNYNQ